MQKNSCHNTTVCKPQRAVHQIALASCTSRLITSYSSTETPQCDGQRHVQLARHQRFAKLCFRSSGATHNKQTSRAILSEESLGSGEHRSYRLMSRSWPNASATDPIPFRGKAHIVGKSTVGRAHLDQSHGSIVGRSL